MRGSDYLIIGGSLYRKWLGPGKMLFRTVVGNDEIAPIAEEYGRK